MHMENPLNSKYTMPLPPACGPDRKHAIALDGNVAGGIPRVVCCLWVIHKDLPEMMNKDLLNMK